MLDVMAETASDATILEPLTAAELEAWLGRQDGGVAGWVRASAFKAKPGQTLPIPGDGGRLARILLGVERLDDPWSYAGLATSQGDSVLRIERQLDAAAAEAAALGFALGAYRFGRYKKDEAPKTAKLVWPEGADRAAVVRKIDAHSLARDLINTPANDMGPPELADAARRLAEAHGARFKVIVGQELLDQNYPTIHAVGRAAAREPRLIDFTWGDESAPKVTLVGKGVCFDTGGLDLKPAQGMRLMKKDMGGAANILALAHMVMAAELPVRLRMLVPAVENSVSGDAMRPLDVIRTRAGLTVEVGNTDAEGRLVLCDALTEADSEKPALIIDMATLTGAARVALGTDLPALFCNDDRLADDLLRHGESERDPMWRLPLYQPYARLLDSDTADLNNVSEGGFGGAITAALYLERFVSEETPWAHLDMIAWNVSSRPGRPRGGEAQTVRAAFAMLQERFGA